LQSAVLFTDIQTLDHWCRPGIDGVAALICCNHTVLIGSDSNCIDGVATTYRADAWGIGAKGDAEP